jgi:hypothetical protein
MRLKNGKSDSRTLTNSSKKKMIKYRYFALSYASLDDILVVWLVCWFF